MKIDLYTIDIPMVITLIVGVLILVWISLKPHCLMYLLLISAFPFFRLVKLSAGNVNIYYQDMLFILYSLFLGIYFIDRLLKRRDLPTLAPDVKRLLIFVFLYLSLQLSYIFLALLKGISLQNIIRRSYPYLQCIYLFLPVCFIKSENQLRRILLFVIFISSCFPLWQLFIFFTGSGAFVTSSGTVRLAGSHLSPLLASTVFALILWHRGWSKYLLISAPIMSIVLIAHRSAYVALFLGLAFLFYFLKELKKPILLAYIASLLVVTAIYVLSFFTGHNFMEDATTRMVDTFSAEHVTTVGRIERMKNSYIAFRRYPLAGIGYDYEILSKVFTNEAAIGGVLHPHNFVIRHLTHTGVLGTILILSIIAQTLLLCFLGANRFTAERTRFVFLFCTLVFFILISLMNTEFFVHGYFYWIPIGVTLYYRKRELTTQLVSKSI
jgi:O-antigen ligase